MKTDELREKYLAFFESKGCVRKPSDVLVPHGDKSVLFTPAGMNQFKEQFLGIGKLEFTRATTCQKCLRTGDIDNVGVTAYHHTFFEMLGNFSFGDYFKREAIHWAWEFLTDKKWLGLNKDWLTVTVYLDDDEAHGIWNKEIGVPVDRIRREGEGENFWPASAPSQGPDGVCGPCSEIYFHPRGGKASVEIWNLVFTQFNRVGAPPNNLQPLPKNNIDTGMGLERTAAVLQGHESNYENDVLKPLCLAAAEAAGVKYDFTGKTGRPIRRIADHARAVTFCIHENVVPANEMQGYIVRQLLRRATLEGYLLGKHDPFVYQLVGSVAEVMRSAYPELKESIGRVADVVKAEEEAFLRSVERGVRSLDKQVEIAKTQNGVIAGDVAWDLHSTHGFLIEITEAIAASQGLKVDRAAFEASREKHAQTSREGGGVGGTVMAAGPLDTLREKHSGTEFLGYGTTQAEGRVIGILAGEALVDKHPACENSVVVVLDRTPFYGESGGQVGDTGTLAGAGLQAEVLDTKKYGAFTLHVTRIRSGELQVGQTLAATVDADRRAGLQRAHSATHLLHHALQTHLGKDATQRGSKVEPDVLRFDFAHNKAIDRDTLRLIEDDVNALVLKAEGVSWEVMPIAKAKELGAMALFGERYPDNVRVVSMGGFSRELCGGTHLTNTAQVGCCKIVSEESTAVGTRRIVAYTGKKALERIREEENLLVEAAMQLKAPRAEDVPQRLQNLLDEVKRLKQEVSRLSTQSAAAAVDDYVQKAERVAGVSLIAHEVENADADSMRSMIDELRRKAGSMVTVLGTRGDGKVLLMVGLSKDVVEKGLHAVEIVKAAARLVGGGGGGRPDLAQAGGKNPAELPAALAEALRFVKAKLGG